VLRGYSRAVATGADQHQRSVILETPGQHLSERQVLRARDVAFSVLLGLPDVHDMGSPALLPFDFFRPDLLVRYVLGHGELLP
jgi:hypothetical protein